MRIIHPLDITTIKIKQHKTAKTGVAVTKIKTIELSTVVETKIVTIVINPNT